MLLNHPISDRTGQFMIDQSESSSPESRAINVHSVYSTVFSVYMKCNAGNVIIIQMPHTYDKLRDLSLCY